MTAAFISGLLIGFAVGCAATTGAFFLAWLMGRLLRKRREELPLAGTPEEDAAVDRLIAVWEFEGWEPERPIVRQDLH